MNDYIFDLDGTLIDSSVDIINSIEKSYKSVMKKVINVDKKLIYGSFSTILSNIDNSLTEEEKHRINEEYRKIYNNCGFPNTKAYPYVVDILSKYSCYLVTSKPLNSTLLVISKLSEKGIYLNFENMVCGKDKVIGIKETIKTMKLKDSIYIGDTKDDMLAAKKAKVKYIHALYGFQGDIGAKDNINSIGELL